MFQEKVAVNTTLVIHNTVSSTCIMAFTVPFSKILKIELFGN